MELVCAVPPVAAAIWSRTSQARYIDVAWFGLIGSQTKRARFESRLRQRGLSDERLARMVCPIGVSGIHGKEPEVIAVAVVAQLLQLT